MQDKKKEDYDGITCEECRYMIDYFEPYKWPEICGVCGNSTKRLVEIEKRQFTKNDQL